MKEETPAEFFLGLIFHPWRQSVSSDDDGHSLLPFRTKITVSLLCWLCLLQINIAVINILA